MSPKLLTIFFITAFLFSCHNRIETGDTLSASDKKYIQGLGLLDSGETIIKFNSQLNNQVSGNFFTNKRLASYWMDERDAGKNHKAFAFYKDIAAIDTNYMRTSLTYAPYLEITRKDSTKFKVYVDGKESDVRSFFEEASLLWISEQLKHIKNQRYR